MNKPATLQKIADFFLTKIIIGILVVVGCVALVESAGRSLLDKTQLSGEFKNTIVGITQAALALLSYVLLFQFYEKRKIRELSVASFWINAPIGFLAGLLLQSLVIVIIYLAGGYSILQVNPVSFLLPSFITALTAGFVAEIVIRGILFRLTEERLGTVIALIISSLLFAIMHSGSKGATPLSILSTTVQAGIMLSAAYVFTRSLWLSIFLHFAWDLAEPGIYGGINPGITLEKSLFTSKISGDEILTGGQFGPGNSIQAALFCLLTALLFLWLAKKKNNFLKPYWKK
jgi:uncharacterized protein